MAETYNERELAALQEVYDKIIKDLYGDCLPNRQICENIASGVLHMARRGETDWHQLVTYTGSKTHYMLQERNLLPIK